jgi:hypothetical protein
MTVQLDQQCGVAIGDFSTLLKVLPISMHSSLNLLILMLLMLFLNCINVLSLEIAVSSTAAVVLLALLYNVD